MRNLFAAWLLTNRLAQPPDMLDASMRSSGECVELFKDSFHDLLCEAWQAQDGTTRQGFSSGRYAPQTSRGFHPAQRYSTVTLTVDYGVPATPLAPIARRPDANRAGKSDDSRDRRDGFIAANRAGMFERS
ncbi:hypothetical protein [Paraburkholderia sp.]|uniref:hypothetical protein n=1 Tax=Paraburkholderia sp. TaxID=1926495 RepID=UPI003D6E6A94